MRNQNDISDIRTDQGLFTLQGLSSVQWQLGSNYFPLQKIEMGNSLNALGSVQMFDQVLDWLGWENRDQAAPCIKFEDYAFVSNAPLTTGWLSCPNYYHLNGQNVGNSFFMVLDLDRTRNQIAGYNTVDDVVDIQLLLSLNPYDPTTGDPYNAFLPSNIQTRPIWNPIGDTSGLAGMKSYTSGDVPGGVAVGLTNSQPGLMLSFPIVVNDSFTNNGSSLALSKPVPTSVRIDSFCEVDQIFSLERPLQAVIKR